MVTQNPPLDNSFCNYVDDTPGGHFGTSADVQIAEYAAAAAATATTAEWARRLERRAATDETN